MHKYLFITLILIFTFQCLYADSDNFELSLSTGFSTMYGSVHEYVYDAGGKASRLDWDIKPMVLLGIGVNGGYKNIHLVWSIYSAISEDTGSIEDYDWDTSTGELTNYSKHDVKQKGSIFTDVITSYGLRIDERIELLPGIGIRYNDLQLTAENGYLEYPPGSTPENVYGKGIIYEQEYIFPYIAFGLNYYTAAVDLKLLTAYSCFVRCDARDSHIKRDIDFYDEIRDAKFYMVQAGISYHVSEVISLSVSAEGVYMPESKGNSYYIDLSTGEKSQTINDAGGFKAGHLNLNISVCMKIL